MNVAHWIRSSLAAGCVALGAMYAFVAGCGSGNQESPPSTQAQAQTTAPGESAPGAGGMHHRHMPPPAAFDACKSKAVGDACTVSLHDREINGKCESPPPGSEQAGPACRPEGMRHRHGPPPEAVFAACDGKAEGDACSVVHEHGTAQGSCKAPRFDGGTARLLCAAAHGRGHGDAGGGG